MICQGPHLDVLEDLFLQSYDEPTRRVFFAIEDLSRTHRNDSSQLSYSMKSDIMFRISDLSLWLTFDIRQSLD